MRHTLISLALAACGREAMTGPPPIPVTCPDDAPVQDVPAMTYGMGPQDTRLDRRIAAQLCATRTPCEIGLQDGGTWDGHTYFVAELHLGFRAAGECHRMERWLVVDDRDTYALGSGCDGEHEAWDRVDIRQMPPQLHWHRTYLSTGYRRDQWFAIDLAATGPRIIEVGETVDHPIGGVLDRSWWTWAVPGSTPEGGAIERAGNGNVSYSSARHIPAVELDDAFADGAWKTTELAACAQTIGPRGRQLSVVRADTHDLYLEIDDDRRTRGDRVRLDVEVQSDCDVMCGDDGLRGGEDGRLRTVEIALATGKVTGPAHVTVERVDARRTRAHVELEWEVIAAAAELVDDDGAGARVETTTQPRHKPSPVLSLPHGLACERTGGALVLAGAAVVPKYPR